MRAAGRCAPVAACVLLSGIAAALSSPKSLHGQVVSPGDRTSTLQAPAMSSVPALLDRYSGGDIEGVVAAFAAIDDAQHVRRELEAVAGDWIDAAGTEEVNRRRFLVATFALELVRARLQDEWERLRPLIEWSCELLREGPPTEAERLWHRASIALALGAGDYWLLLAPDASRLTRGTLRFPRRPYHHARHGRDRFPDDERLAFAEALTEAIYVTPAWPNGDRWDAVAATSRRRQLSQDAAEKLQSFLGPGEVGAEAHLRLGVLLAAGLDRPAEALRHFAHADDQSNAFIAYLARYYAGRVQEMAGAVEQAEAAYRAALAVQPRTPSASLSLAFLLLSSGRGTEASDVMARSLESPPEIDPFRVHGFADYRFIEALFMALRRELGS